jgi:hypothetical protein
MVIPGMGAAATMHAGIGNADGWLAAVVYVKLGTADASTQQLLPALIVVTILYKLSLTDQGGPAVHSSWQSLIHKLLLLLRSFPGRRQRGGARRGRSQRRRNQHQCRRCRHSSG